MKYYTTEEVADILGVAITTVYTYMKSGDLKGYKVGMYWRFKEEDIEAFVTRKSSRDLQKEKEK